MKLFIEEKKGAHKTGKKLYIDKIAPTKRELHQLIGNKEFFIDGERYYVSQVIAEPSSNGTATGIAVGGVLGVLGGAWGVAAGGLVGGILGKSSDEKDAISVRKFNGSSL
jgi:hypothetical protein